MKSLLVKKEARYLQECLEALAAGEDLESILRRYPRQADSLRRALQAADWLTRHRAALQPSASFVQASQARLLHDLRQRTTPRQQRRRQFAFHLRRLGMSLQPVVVILLLLTLLNIPFQLFQAARVALPGDQLYPLKRFQEQARLAFTFDPLTKAQLHIQYAQQRAMEVQELMLDGRFEHLNLAVNSYQAQMERTRLALEDVAQRDPNMAKELHQSLTEALEAQGLVTSFLIEVMPSGLRTGLRQALWLGAP